MIKNESFKNNKFNEEKARTKSVNTEDNKFGKEPPREEKVKTESVNSENNPNWKTELKDESKGNKTRVTIESLNPGQKFFIKNDRGEWIKCWGATKIGKGRDVSYVYSDGKGTLPWGSEVFIEKEEDKEKEKSFVPAELHELRPGDEFVVNVDGRRVKGKVLVKYGEGLPQGRDISVLLGDEMEKRFFPWNKNIEIDKNLAEGIIRQKTGLS